MAVVSSPAAGGLTYPPHVYFHAHPLTFDQRAGMDVKAFFDETRSELVVVRESCVVDAYPVLAARRSTISSNISVTVSFKEPGIFTCPRFSLDRRFLAVQRSDTEVEFFDLVSGGSFREFMLAAKSTKSQTRILDFFWPLLDDFFIVTNYTLESYSYNTSKRKFLLNKSLSMPINWSVYSHIARLVLVATNARGTAIHPVLIRKGVAIKLVKFDLDVDPSVTVTPADISVTFLYSKLYCIHKNQGERRITLYSITRDNALKSAVIELPVLPKGVAPKTFSVSAVDNLLLVHQCDVKVTSLYDIKVSTETPVAQSLSVGLLGVGLGISAAASPVIVPPTPVSELLSVTPSIGGGGASSSTRLPTTIVTATASPLLVAYPDSPRPLELYGEHWEYYMPDVVLDRHHGICWTLDVDLTAIASTFTDDISLMAFLVKRSHSKMLIIATLRRILTTTKDLRTVGLAFDMLNQVCALALVERQKETGGNRTESTAEAPKSWGEWIFGSEDASRAGTSEGLSPPPPSTEGSGGPSTGSSGGALPRSALSSDEGRDGVSSGSGSSGVASAARAALSSGESGSSRVAVRPKSRVEGHVTTKEGYAVIDQADVYGLVLMPMMEEEKSIPPKFMIAIIVEYIRSLNENRLDVAHCLHEILIKILVQQEKYHQLHQFLQYHVVSDSLPVAYVLLALDAKYPPAYQLSLDMLKRLGHHEEIVEVLLSRQQILAALRYIRSNRVRSVSARHFLEVALQTDESLFFTVFTFFQHRNQAMRGSPLFLPEDNCDTFVAIFKERYGRSLTASSVSLPPGSTKAASGSR